VSTQAMYDRFTRVFRSGEVLRFLNDQAWMEKDRDGNEYQMTSKLENLSISDNRGLILLTDVDWAMPLLADYTEQEVVRKPAKERKIVNRDKKFDDLMYELFSYGYECSHKFSILNVDLFLKAFASSQDFSMENLAHINKDGLKLCSKLMMLPHLGFTDDQVSKIIEFCGASEYDRHY
jgi:hypothetical protein